MSGQAGQLNRKQSSTLEEFKEQVKDILEQRPKYDNDHFLLRWLRARNFDLKKAETMLRNNFAWRQANGVDTILQDFEPPEVMKKYFCGSICGHDKEGFLVFLDTFGLTDMRGILMSLRKQEIVRSRIWLLEDIYRQCEERTKKEGKQIDQVVVIFDLDKFGMKHLWKPGVDVFMEIVSMCESNYPETLKKAFVINAPRIFPIAFNIIKPILSEETQRKITICGADYKEVLLQSIDADQLPSYWGGTLTDPDGDPRCPSMIVAGGPVPESYYGNNNLGDLSGFTEASIGRGSSLQLDFDILKPASAIRWHFKTDGFDIGFGVFCRTSEQRQKKKAMKEILASQRVNSHMLPEYGMVHCASPGTYVVRFDNTFSWMRTKKLYYVIEILEPNACDLDGASNVLSRTNSSLSSSGGAVEDQENVFTTFTSDDTSGGGRKEDINNGKKEGVNNEKNGKKEGVDDGKKEGGDNGKEEGVDNGKKEEVDNRQGDSDKCITDTDTTDKNEGIERKIVAS